MCPSPLTAAAPAACGGGGGAVGGAIVRVLSIGPATSTLPPAAAGDDVE
jgi:hypothetical protein